MDHAAPGNDTPIDYSTVLFMHAIAGLPEPPPEEEIVDMDKFAHETIAGLMRGFGPWGA